MHNSNYIRNTLNNHSTDLHEPSLNPAEFIANLLGLGLHQFVVHFFLLPPVPSFMPRWLVS